MANAGAMGMMHEVRAPRRTRPLRVAHLSAAAAAAARVLAPTLDFFGRLRFLAARRLACCRADCGCALARSRSQGYFVGRKELIGWVQQYFQPNFSKVEDCASGVVYCQIIDSIYPGAVPMSKVKMGAKTEVDFIHNFKILQTAFSKKRIDRAIEIDKLSKKSFQTNMEFLQFMKCYWDMHAPNGEGGGMAAPLAEETQAAKNAVPTPEKAKPQKPAMAGGAKRAAKPAAKPAEAAGGMPRAAAAAAHGAGGASSAADVAAAQMEVTELKLSVENLERERDFYYSKLREVEVLCQAHEGESSPFLHEVLEILYKTDEADEFVTPDEAEVAVH